MSDSIVTLADIGQSVSVIIACWTVISGINAWRREFIGKRRIELAEETLEAFFAVRDAITVIRNPFSFGKEGSSRQRGQYENEADSELLDRAFIVFERYQKQEEVFRKFATLKYRFMATFGKETERIFSELHKTINKIFVSAQMLGTHYWPRQGRVQMTEQEFRKHLDEMHKHEAVFWEHGGDHDEIRKDLDVILGDLEKVTAPAFEGESGIYSFFTKKLPPWRT